MDVPSWKYPRGAWNNPRVSSPDFGNDSKMMVIFSLQSDSHRTLIWREPGTRYHQENTIKRHHYGNAGWLVWGGIILGSRTDLRVQSVTKTSHIYRDVILEQHVRLFRGSMGIEFPVCWMTTPVTHRASGMARVPSIGGYHPYRLASILTGLESIEHVGYAWPTNDNLSTPSPPVYRNFEGHCLMSGVIFPKIRLII
ncbi:DDE_3 domain-containing protein [Trichonephila clavipes]|nr:DDE_3 domain-containing protein [Trichonephila clavipes]